MGKKSKDKWRVGSAMKNTSRLSRAVGGNKKLRIKKGGRGGLNKLFLQVINRFNIADVHHLNVPVYAPHKPAKHPPGPDF